MKKLSVLLLLVFVLWSCGTPSSTIESIALNEDHRWEVTYSDGRKELLDIQSGIVENVYLNEDDYIVIEYQDGESQTLDIQWKYHTVSFKTGPNELYRVQFVLDGDAAEGIAPPSKSGHTFLEWDKDLSEISASIEVYAVFEANEYTITIHTEVDDPLTVKVEHGETVNLPTVTKEGYVLENIYTDETFKNVFDKNTGVTQSLSLHYRWIPETMQYSQALFEEVMELFRNRHYKNLTQEEFYRAAMFGLINALEDPYTSYMTPDEMERFSQRLGEDFVGVGITVENINDNVVVRKVWSGSPAENAGIRPGDRITHIDGVNVENYSYLDTVIVLLGEENTTVEIGVARVNIMDTLFFTMTRTRIPNPSVEYEVFNVDDQVIGYLKINSFGAQTYNLMGSALEDLEDNEHIEGLIIDLRDNGGGFLTAVLNMLDTFLIEGELPMFSTRSISGGTAYDFDYNATGTSLKPYDIVVMINGQSASASEVFAAGMQEKGGYTIIGETSFGKGSMQTSVTLSNGSSINVSIGQWFTPTGQWVHRGEGDLDGVEPDIYVEQNPYFRAYVMFLQEDETLEFDEVSSQIANLQTILTMYGYDVRTDGYFDLVTENAVKDLQESLDLDITGVVDNTLIAYINEFLINFITNPENDEQLSAALSYFELD